MPIFAPIFIPVSSPISSPISMPTFMPIITPISCSRGLLQSYKCDLRNSERVLHGENLLHDVWGPQVSVYGAQR